MIFCAYKEISWYPLLVLLVKILESKIGSYYVAVTMP